MRSVTDLNKNWGDGVTDWGYLDYLKDAQSGDIIVAGGIEKVKFIGEVNDGICFTFRYQPEGDNFFYTDPS
jgi:hypothetical protein